MKRGWPFPFFAGILLGGGAIGVVALYVVQPQPAPAEAAAAPCPPAEPVFAPDTGAADAANVALPPDLDSPAETAGDGVANSQPNPQTGSSGDVTYDN